MNRNTNIIIGIIAMALIIGGIVYFQGGKEQKVKGIKIGSFLPLTGDFGSLGEEIKKGADLAVEEAKAKGVQIEYISEDEALDPKKTVTVAQKLLTIDKVDVAFTATIQEVKPVAENFNQARVPLVAVWDSNNYVKSVGDHVFSIGFSTEGNGEKMAEYAYQDLKLRKVALVMHIDEWSELISKAFVEKFTTLGGEVVLQEKTLPTEKNFKTVIAKVKDTQADGVFFPLFPGSCGLFLKQSQEMGLKSIFMTGDSFSQDDITIAGAGAEGVYIANLFADNTKELVVKYKAKYGKEPAYPVFVGFGYDGINTILNANKSAGEKNTSLRDALTKVNIQGTIGPINMNGKTYSEKIEKIDKVVNGSFVTVKE